MSFIEKAKRTYRRNAERMSEIIGQQEGISFAIAFDNGDKVTLESEMRALSEEYEVLQDEQRRLSRFLGKEHDHVSALD